MRKANSREDREMHMSSVSTIVGQEGGAIEFAEFVWRTFEAVGAILISKE